MPNSRVPIFVATNRLTCTRQLYIGLIGETNPPTKKPALSFESKVVASLAERRAVVAPK